MEYARLRPVGDVSVGDWIAPRLGPFGGWVGSVVRRGFEAYARVLHPVQDAHGAPATWADVCAFTGRRAHALMQWRSIADGRPPGTVTWQGDEPEAGNLGTEALGALCRVLSSHAGQASQCYFAIWDGYGWLHGNSAVVTAGHVESIPRSFPASVPPPFPPEVVSGPRLRLPGRDYILLTGPLDAATELGHRVTDDWFEAQSPNLFWPKSRAWCVASEIDFDSTLVAGTSALIADVLGEPDLEAWPVDPGDSLAHDGDTLNV